MAYNNDKIATKKAMIEALVKSLGIVTSACKAVNISRQTHYEWLKQDEEYRLNCESVNEITLDFAESKLFKLMRDENPSAIFYYLNNKGEHRGYSNRQKVDHTTGGEKINVISLGTGINPTNETTD